MGRKTSNTADWFVHECNHARLLFILENRWKNDGYSFWFKMLEVLSTTEGHALDCGKDENWLYLLSKTLVSEEVAVDILNCLVKLEKIDGDLWSGRRVIWCQSFVDGLEELYKKRGRKLPVRPVFCTGNDACSVIPVPSIHLVELSTVEISTEKKPRGGEISGGEVLAEETAPGGAVVVSPSDPDDDGVLPAGAPAWPIHLLDVFKRGCNIFGEDAGVLCSDESRRMVLQDLIGHHNIGIAGFLEACEAKARAPGLRSITFFLDDKEKAVKRVTALLAGGKFVGFDELKNKNSVVDKEVGDVAKRYG
jgi:hypothetical protein